MSDDGTGAGLRIPAVLVGSEDGNKIIKFFETASKSDRLNANININFMKPHPKDVVDFNFWFTSGDSRSMMFLQNIKELIGPIINEINFTPRQVTWSCPQCTKEFIHKNCYSKGKYCAMSSDLALDYGGSIVMEDL
jgi:hypothetical protein